MKFEYWEALFEGMNWHWQLKDDQGEVIFKGREGYINEYGVIEAIERFKREIAEARTEHGKT